MCRGLSTMPLTPTQPCSSTIPRAASCPPLQRGKRNHACEQAGQARHAAPTCCIPRRCIACLSRAAMRSTHPLAQTSQRWSGCAPREPHLRWWGAHVCPCCSPLARSCGSLRAQPLQRWWGAHMCSCCLPLARSRGSLRAQPLQRWLGAHVCSCCHPLARSRGSLRAQPLQRWWGAHVCPCCLPLACCLPAAHPLAARLHTLSCRTPQGPRQRSRGVHSCSCCLWWNEVHSLVLPHANGKWQGEPFCFAAWSACLLHPRPHHAHAFPPSWQESVACACYANDFCASLEQVGLREMIEENRW